MSRAFARRSTLVAAIGWMAMANLATAAAQDREAASFDVTGNVLELGSGAPVDGARLEIDSLARVEVTGARGRFSFTDLLRALIGSRSSGSAS